MVETLYNLGLEEMIFSPDHPGLYNYEWQNKLKEAGFHLYYGSCRIVFTHPDLNGWVIKTDYLPRAHYTAREVQKYQEAVACGMEQYFLPVYSLGFSHGHEFFTAPLVTCGEERMSDYLSQREGGDEEDQIGRAAYLLDEANTDEILESAFGDDAGYLGDWLEAHDIDDIHMGNIGALENGDIVIIDYASWQVSEVFYDD